MSDQAFQIGDTVQLRGGGPTMTVEGVHEHTARCLWHATDGVLHRETFGLDTLKLVKPLMGYVEEAQQYVEAKVAAWRQQEQARE